MSVKGRKTKKMLIGLIRKEPSPPLSLDGAVIDQVKTLQLLGVHVFSDDLKWPHHIDAISSRDASCLHFLKLLARSRASLEDLMCFYTSVVPDSGACLPKPHFGSGGRPGVNSGASYAFYMPSGLQDGVYNCWH